MKITLLRHRKIGEPSCSKLVRALNELGVEVNKVDEYDESNPDILIRWGHTGRFPISSDAIQLNTPESISTGANKRESRKLLADSGTSVPATYYSKMEARAAVGERGERLIGRKDTHTQGKEAEIIATIDDVDNSRSTYWSKIIDKAREIRVYVFGGSVIGVVEKFPADPSAVLWNRHQGATFTDVSRDDISATVQMLAVQAAMRVGQYFSGVDIIIDRDGQAYVLELNSSIGLSNPHRVEIFAKGFKRVVDHYAKKGELL